MIEAQGLRVRTESGLALDDLSLRVGPGEIYVLLGPRGAGKTTLVDAFAGVVTPERGRARIDSIDAAREPLEARRRATVVRADAAFYDSLSPRRNVQFFARTAGVNNVTRSRAIDALRHSGVPDRAINRPMRELDGSTHLLVWLGLAALRETKALLIDEPSMALDDRSAGEVHESLLALRRQGVAILMTLSDVTRATQTADRIGILRAGHLIGERTRAQVLAQSVAQFQAEYAGTPSPLAPARSLQ